jgi:acyl-CoA reductase-like NAD-dependent aldehyde dehydrogenase
MSDYKLLIDGQLVDGDLSMEVLNPATEQILCACPRASADQLHQAVAAARSAFAAWSQTELSERQAVLVRIADIVDANTEDLARILTQEQGRPIAGTLAEIKGTAAFFRYFSTISFGPEILENSETRRIEAHRRPIGVIGAIVPWNVPMVLMAFKVPAALLAGNTVVLKPAPTTPLTTLAFGALVRDIVPPGVLNIIADANELGDLLTAHPDVQKISFTGSTATGSKVMASAAETLKRITLELGGNDAGIVLDDVDPKTIAPKLFQAAFQNNGQVCVALKRLYVHESLYDAICDELAALADAAIVGDGLEQGVDFGPLQNRMQYDRVRDILKDARMSGQVIAGGDVPTGPGYFIRPTIVRDITDGARLVDEEQFGPVLPVIKYSDPDDAVTRANASPFGLGGSVWSADAERAARLAGRMEAGTVWVNKHGELVPYIPFGGAKKSGLGLELGYQGLKEFTQLTIVNVAL